MKFPKLGRCSFGLLLGLACIISAPRPITAEEPYTAEIDTLRKSLEKYQDYKVAVRDFTYRPWAACITLARKSRATWNIPRGPWACTSSISRCAARRIR